MPGPFLAAFCILSFQFLRKFSLFPHCTDEKTEVKGSHFLGPPSCPVKDLEIPNVHNHVGFIDKARPLAASLKMGLFSQQHTIALVVLNVVLCPKKEDPYREHL